MIRTVHTVALARRDDDEATNKKNDTLAAGRRDDDETTKKENDSMAAAGYYEGRTETKQNEVGKEIPRIKMMVRVERNTETRTQTNATAGKAVQQQARQQQPTNTALVSTENALKRAAEERWNDPRNNEANWKGTTYHRRQPSYWGCGKQKMSRRTHTWCRTEDVRTRREEDPSADRWSEDGKANSGAPQELKQSTMATETQDNARETRKHRVKLRQGEGVTSDQPTKGERDEGR